jgi:hypothetical protein
MELSDSVKSQSLYDGTPVDYQKDDDLTLIPVPSYPDLRMIHAPMYIYRGYIDLPHIRDKLIRKKELNKNSLYFGSQLGTDGNIFKYQAKYASTPVKLLCFMDDPNYKLHLCEYIRKNIPDYLTNHQFIILELFKIVYGLWTHPNELSTIFDDTVKNLDLPATTGSTLTDTFMSKLYELVKCLRVEMIRIPEKYTDNYNIVLNDIEDSWRTLNRMVVLWFYEAVNSNCSSSRVSYRPFNFLMGILFHHLFIVNRTSPYNGFIYLTQNAGYRDDTLVCTYITNRVKEYPNGESILKITLNCNGSDIVLYDVSDNLRQICAHEWQKTQWVEIEEEKSDDWTRPSRGSSSRGRTRAHEWQETQWVEIEEEKSDDWTRPSRGRTRAHEWQETQWVEIEEEKSDDWTRPSRGSSSRGRTRGRGSSSRGSSSRGRTRGWTRGWTRLGRGSSSRGRSSDTDSQAETSMDWRQRKPYGGHKGGNNNSSMFDKLNDVMKQIISSFIPT